jgi:hypothetical protein
MMDFAHKAMICSVGHDFLSTVLDESKLAIEERDSIIIRRNAQMLQDVGQAYVRTRWRQNLHFIARRAFVTRANCAQKPRATRFIAGPRHQKVARRHLAKGFCKFANSTRFLSRA